MRKLCSIFPIIAMLIIAGCQATPTPLDLTSIQNTAVAMAWTSVAKTSVWNDKLTQSPLQTLTKAAAPTSTPKPTSTPRPTLSPLDKCRNGSDIIYFITKTGGSVGVFH